jgi:mannonate dehydratase
MKLGISLHRSHLSRENFRFARQAGCTHLILHLVERFQGLPMRQADEFCFGFTRAGGQMWSHGEIEAIERMATEEGLAIEALENLDPSFLCDILLDGPRKQQQIESLKGLLRTMGRLKIPVLGYNFSLAGVWGRINGPFARGQAVTPAFIESRLPEEKPIPSGTLHNLVYDPDAPPGTIPAVSREELWERLVYFLRGLTPVAEEEGVRLAAHPDDPPVPMLRQTPRLLHSPHCLQQLLDAVPSSSNTLRLCLGTVQEMPGVDVYEVADTFSRQGVISYVHCRNVRGKVPHYSEVFIDEGDIDIFRVLRILKTNGFDGVVIPDHTPQMTCGAPWHAGMAHALGYLRAVITSLGDS